MLLNSDNHKSTDAQLSASHTHTHTHTHKQTTTITQVHAFLVMGWQNEKKEMTDQYAEEKKSVFSFEDKGLTERGREFHFQVQCNERISPPGS